MCQSLKLYLSCERKSPGYVLMSFAVDSPYKIKSHIQMKLSLRQPRVRNNQNAKWVDPYGGWSAIEGPTTFQKLYAALFR